MDNLLRYIYQAFLIILFVVFFIGLFATPIIYINIKQKHYFKKLSKKFHLKYDGGNNIIRRNFPKVYGNLDKTPVLIQATGLGTYTHDAVNKTRSFASPVVLISLKINNPDIKTFKIYQLKTIEKRFVTNFDHYFTSEIAYNNKNTGELDGSIKQEVLFYAEKNYPLFNIILQDGYLISIAHYELTSERKYRNLLAQIALVKYIHRQLSR